MTKKLESFNQKMGEALSAINGQKVVTLEDKKLILVLVDMAIDTHNDKADASLYADCNLILDN